MSVDDFPIIYVRGYAGDQAGIEATVDDPFYGFNTGSTHVRVNGDGDPIFYEFESPLLRLMEDHGYQVIVRGSQKALLADGKPGSLKDVPRSIWIHRYYDVTSQTFGGSSKRLLIEEAAAGLQTLIEQVLSITTAPKVTLVAHSMGGLVCRSLIQKIYPEAGLSAFDHIDRVFTYATPHGGIEFAVGGGVLDWAMDKIGPHGSNTFGRDRMYAFLTPGAKPDATAPDDFEPRSLGDSFPIERFFCLVGTDPGDYGTAFGLSRTLVGPQSDGLVQIQNASLKGAPRAFVHRSHSGRYGIVNSEEGYQNVQRFLFGDVRVKVSLRGINPPVVGASHQAEIRLAIRGLPVLVNERLTAQHYPILLEDQNGKPRRDLELFTTYMNSKKSATNDNICRYVLSFGILMLSEHHGIFDFSHHLEQVPLWSGFLTVDVTPQDDGGYHAVYGWSTTDDPAQPFGDGGRAELPDEARADSVLGPDAALYVEPSSWPPIGPTAEPADPTE